jgi:hypothetical protein
MSRENVELAADSQPARKGASDGYEAGATRLPPLPILETERTREPK